MPPAREGNPRAEEARWGSRGKWALVEKAAATRASAAGSSEREVTAEAAAAAAAAAVPVEAAAVATVDRRWARAAAVEGAAVKRAVG